MRGKILAKNLLALSLICSTWGLFGFHSGDVEKTADRAQPAVETIIAGAAADNVSSPAATEKTPEAVAEAPRAAGGAGAEEGAAAEIDEKPEITVLAEIDTKSQTMTVRRNGEVLHVWKISSGRAGYETPKGDYRPQHMHTMWHSRTYNNAPMPYAVFFHNGYAVHGTKAIGRLGSRASHGCVRLATENAKAFYRLVREAGVNNTQIIVRN